MTAWIQAIAGELSRSLGWKVNIVPLPFKTLLKNENEPERLGSVPGRLGC